MSVVETSAAVFTRLDPERPCGEIVRVGGGKYRLDKFDGSGSVEGLADFAAATAAAGAYVAGLEADPKADQGTLVIRKLQAALDEANSRIVELEKQVEAKPVGVVGTVDQTLGDAKAG